MNKKTYNACPLCGGTVNIIINIPCSITLHNDDVNIEYSHDETLQKIRKELNLRKKYECTCDDCQADLNAFPTKDPSIYLISPLTK